MNKILLRVVKKIEMPKGRICLGTRQIYNNTNLIENIINENNEVSITYYKDKIVITRVEK